ncbi:MAG: 3-phosphoglycerate dehydrogenase [Phycisphaerae bacterium]|nr:3-phosphoglycerate dehydrogenase [Phycisphaerae bacterium]
MAQIVIQTESLDPEARVWLEERGYRVIAAPLGEVSADDRAAAVALVVRTYTQIDAAALATMPSVRVVGRAGVALDNIDIPACRARGVEVVHTPGANSSAVAEYVFALLFDVTRPRTFVHSGMDLGAWESTRADLLATRQLREMTMGVYGMGRVGQRVARIAQAIEMPVIYNDIREIPASERWGAEPVSRDELFARADVLTVHVDDRPANRGLVDAAAFGAMRPGVIFVSAARGLIVDAEAAAGFFRENPSAIGLFDVHDPEPFGDDYPLLGIDNVHLAPHIAAATTLAKRNMSWVVKDVDRVLRGESPEHRAP